ncbi:uncharacterized protein LOC105439884 [Strongylocentrotus purpuratus]|uniref:Uncharacterized protein n=2 Tax=Strongylocentrotus purpuratus TaxID=7668 RepID=A0A7M7NFD6_STRPU|nr:uncharacterized protein LOC105439884 [Strongylocentrotus purpuratus]
MASKHLSCMQDPPYIQLYVATKVVNINRVQLNKYRCRRGSNSLEGLHSHMYQAIPSKRCGIIPFQVYLISFAVQWNRRMEAKKVPGGRGRLTSLDDPRQVQRLNQHAETLFGKDHLFEPNFSAPMAYPDRYHDPAEEELLGVEYAYSQSTDYIQKAEEQSREVDEELAESEDEGIEDDNDESSLPVNHMDSVHAAHAAVTKEEQVTEEVSPVLEDVLMKRSHLHLPGFQEVEELALLLLQLSDNGDHHIIPVPLREQIAAAANKLADHDRSARNFVKKYESKWGYSLFGRCLGPESPENSSAQKTKFGWMRAAEVTEESRLLYILIKMLKNRPTVGCLSSPAKAATLIKGSYKRIVDRVRDDPVLIDLDIPLPNINAKSITTFISKKEKRTNFLSTTQPKVKSHRNVLSTQTIPEAGKLPQSLPAATFQQVQYSDIPHESGKRHGEKRRLEFDSQPSTSYAVEPPTKTKLLPLLPKTSSRCMPSAASGVPILLVVPSQPQAQSISLNQPSSSVPFSFQPAPPPPPKQTRFLPNPSKKPCAACLIEKCGGLRKRYTPSKAKTRGNTKKIFTFCPTTNRSTTPGFEEVYNNYEHFKKVVDEELERKQRNREEEK